MSINLMGALTNIFTLKLNNKSIHYFNIRVNNTRLVVLNENLIICCACTYRLYTYMYTYNMSEREYNLYRRYAIKLLNNYFI